MVLDSPIISGSATFLGNLVVTGSITTSGSITISGSIASASYATTSSYANNATTASYAVNATTASYAANASNSTLFNSTSSTVFATTGSNTFVGTAYHSNTNDATAFSGTTASIYTDGGLQVTKNTYLSSSLFIKGNLTVYGTQSVNYITSSQLNISTNLITVNTSTPSIRFGGIAVQDSGSVNGLTGSLLWDSQNNIWLYSNPSGSSNYDSAMVLMGPTNNGGLGNEVGIATNYLAKGAGSHHMTSSGIYESASLVGIGTSSPNNLISVRGNADFGTTGYIYAGQSQYGALTFPRGQIMFSNSNTQNQLYIASNAYTSASGVFVYRNSSQTAATIGLDNGGISFLTAGSGSANAAISWTNALNITNAGNVGIGINNPSALLHVSGGTDYNTIFSSTSNRSGWVINTPGTNSPGASGLVLASDGSFRFGNAGQYQIAMYTNNEVGIWGGGSERLRVMSDGSLQLNTAGPGLFTLGASTSYAGISSGGGGVTLYLNGATRGGTTTAASNAAVLALDGNFYITNSAVNSNRMILTTVTPGTIACLLVNKTTPATSYPIQTTSGNGGFMASATGGGDANYYSTSATIGYHIYGDQGGAGKFTVTGAGKGYFASGVQFGNGSSTMNYYEEGTWTPQLYAGTTAFTMVGINEGKYIRIGNQVTVNFHIQWSGGSGSGMVKVSGLPFTSSGVRSAGSIGAIGSGISFDSGYNMWIVVNDPGAAFVYIIESASGGSGYSHTPPVASSGIIYGFSITYFLL